MIQQKTNQKQIIHEFFIFNRLGACLYHIDIDQTAKNYAELQSNQESYSPHNKAIDVFTDPKLENRYKLIFGLLFSIKSFVKNVSPNKGQDYLKTYSTRKYKLHFVEFMTGIRFILLTTPIKGDLTTQLKDLFKGLYVNFVSKNVFTEKDEIIKNEIFSQLIYNYFQELNETLIK